MDGQWYFAFIVDGESGVTIAHHNPALIRLLALGRDPSLRMDATGHFYGDDLLAASESGSWVFGVFLHFFDWRWVFAASFLIGSTS